MNYNRISKKNVERIEGTTNLKALNNFKTSIGKITEDMLKEGFDIQDVYEYMVQEIENKLEEYDDRD